jgi:hypothetical protein
MHDLDRLFSHAVPAQDIERAPQQRVDDEAVESRRNDGEARRRRGEVALYGADFRHLVPVLRWIMPLV